MDCQALRAVLGPDGRVIELGAFHLHQFGYPIVFAKGSENIDATDSVMSQEVLAPVECETVVSDSPVRIDAASGSNMMQGTVDNVTPTKSTNDHLALDTTEPVDSFVTIGTATTTSTMPSILKQWQGDQAPVVRQKPELIKREMLHFFEDLHLEDLHAEVAKNIAPQNQILDSQKANMNTDKLHLDLQDRSSRSWH
ncbi:hypothetical protein BGZ95_010681 [Linnemannia exigua]|uniref:Uncharacterized protein n=1 Tax=Linnemannia exigua TaxID=604196 RepID=A0AAD4H5Q7_9FUNG|nr:hypothetical protein BGZ95_010681 [Linnemannia exigua]